MNDLDTYKSELEDILKRMNSAKAEFKHLNSVNIDKSIGLMEESVFRIDHQLNKKPLVVNSLYIESHGTSNCCMDCTQCVGKYCSFRGHRVDRQYGYCPEFEEVANG